jgi:ribonucleoside-diphosphate reductase beta chain
MAYQDEPLLNETTNRLTVYPIKEDIIWQHFKIQQAAFWTAEEIDFSQDYKDFTNLNDNEQQFIKMILAFFAASDTIVNINLAERFTREVQCREAIITYQWQIMMENIHSEVYSLQIDNLIRDKLEKDKLLNAISHFPCIKKKADWALKWIGSNVSFAQRVIAFAIVEGVFFSGSFAAIFWCKKKNILPGLCDSNELISRDEGFHTEFACIIYEHCKNKIDQSIVHDMFKEALEIESEFITESIPCSLLGMNNELMIQYIKFCADRLLLCLSYEKIWCVENPFLWMESISMESKTNFFESRPTQYQKASVLNQGKENTFELDDNF